MLGVIFRLSSKHGSNAAPKTTLSSVLNEALEVLNKGDIGYYAYLLQTCANMKALEEGKQLHALMLKHGTEQTMVLDTKLINLYTQCGFLVYARQLFDKMPERDALSWTVMIGGLAKQGQWEETVRLFYQMRNSGIQPNNFTFPSVLRACANLTALQEGRDIHEYIVRNGFEPDVFVESALIDMYARCGRLEFARQVFDKMHQRDLVAWNAMITGYAKNGHTPEAIEVFHEMQLAGFKPDLITWNALITGYSHAGNTDEALKLFNQMQLEGSAPDTVSWTALIMGYVQNFRGIKALKLFSQMQQAGVKPNSITIASILPACANLLAIQHGRSMHGYVIRNGFESEIVVGNALVDMYAKCGSIEDARQVFEEMQDRDLVSWNAMISGYSQSRHCREALRLFQHMTSEGLGPDSVTITSILPACANLAALRQGKEIHGWIIRNGVGLGSFLENALVDMYAKCARVDDACMVFDKMAVKNVVSWNSMIVALAQNGLCNEALSLFRQMQLEGVEPNPVTILSILPSCGNLAALQAGREIHCYSMRSRFDSDVAVGNALIAMYAQCESIEDARQVFKEMHQMDVCSWTAMIAGYAQNNRHDDAFDIFHRMQKADVKANSITIGSLVTACADSASLREGKETHDYVIRHGHEVDVVVGNALMAMYARCGNIEYARHVFDRASERSIISWNTMLAAYTQNGYGDLALKLFCQMPVAGIKPNSVAIASVLPACAYIAGLQQGKEIHGFILRSGFEADVFVGSAVVDMYAKCGSINDAFRVFKDLHKRDVVAWTAMIVGYAMHGHAEAALTLFSQMQLEGPKPNKVTFTGVLCACSHAGLVEEGWRCFDLMSKDFNITPEIEHYACMVDLLGRAGLLDEAHDFIKSMPFEPSARVWGALLGACKIHSNIDLGKHVAEQLFQLERKGTGNYVLLANMYAASGRWDDVDMVRNTMKEKGLIKNPGCSWIVVKNRVHTFLSSDTSHPELQEFHAMLGSLAGEMKEVGCALDQNDRLLNVEDGEEDNMLYSIYR